MIVVWSFPGEENLRSNPYTATLVRELRALGLTVATPGWLGRLLGRCNIVHLHWPQKVIQPSLAASLRSTSMWLVFLTLQKARGARIVWTLHNVQSHEAHHPKLEQWWMRRFLRLVDGVHAMSETSLAEAEAIYPAVASKMPLVAPHWTYGNAYPPARSDLAHRHDAIAFLGDIKPYKGIEEFLVALEQAKPDTHRYVVHGRPMDGVEPLALAERLDQLRRRGWLIEAVLDRLSEQEMSDRLAQAGLLVLPYRTGENSGLAVLAAERGTPILVAAIPAFEPLLSELGPPRVAAIESPLTHSQMVRAFVAARPVAGSIDVPFSQSRTPAAIVREIRNYYLFLMDGRRE